MPRKSGACCSPMRRIWLRSLALAAAAVSSLPSILASGPRWPDAVLAAIWEHLIHSSPASAAGIGLVCDALEEIAANWPRGATAAHLKLGAIGGGATRRVLDRLARSGTALSYVATSADAEQSARLSFLAESFNGVSACQWSPQDGTEALDQTGFDIILAVNACARLQLDANGFADRGGFSPTVFSSRSSPSRTHSRTWYLGQGLRMVAGWGSRAAMRRLCRSAEKRGAELAEAGFRSADAASSAWALVAMHQIRGDCSSSGNFFLLGSCGTAFRHGRRRRWRRAPPWCMIASATLATGSRSLVRQMRLPRDCRDQGGSDTPAVDYSLPG